MRAPETATRLQPEHALIAACDQRTRIISISSVSYSTGVRYDLAQLGRFCRQQGILFCVDAIQSLGALPVDVQNDHIDCLACGAHKWLMAPEGLGFLYVTPTLRAQLSVHQYGWRMTDQPFAFNQTQLAITSSARRFESGTLNTLGMIGLEASLSLIEDIGVRSIEDCVLDNSRFLIQGLKNIALQLVTPEESKRHAGIICLQADSKSATKRLHYHLKKNGIITALRAGCVRLSPHFYTPREKLEITLECIEKFCAR